MPSVRTVRIYRFIEKVTLAIFITWSGGISVLYGIGEIAGNDVLAGIGISIILLLLILAIQRTVDSWLTVSFSQSNFAEKDVFESLYERSPVGYLTIDKKGLILNSNASAVHLLKSKKDLIQGINFYDLVLENEEAVNHGLLEGKVEAGLTVKDEEIPLKTLDGQIAWVMISIFPYRNTRERLMSLVDITEQKNIDTAKSEFVALATHQLRTPIAAIRWNVELLEKSLESVKTDPQIRYLKKIERNVIKMIELINDFLSVSKLEMGTYASEEINLNLNDFFNSIVDEFTEKINEKQIKLNRKDLSPEVLIKTDKRLIHIIVSNLMSNAVKYTNANGNLSFSYELSGESLEIVFSDDGIGIPEGELSKLFTKFYRASNAQSHQTEGTGLGLYIVKQSVEKLGGSITVESEEYNGTKFVVKIPVSVVSGF